MRLASIKTTGSQERDGQLTVVSSDGRRGAPVPGNSMLRAFENWSVAEGQLKEFERALQNDSSSATVDLSKENLLAPLPRTWGFLDGSAFIQHVILVRKARGAEPPEDLYTVPLMYQGLSDRFLGPQELIPLLDASHGLDFEGEVAVVLDHVPAGTKAADAGQYIKLLLLLNDVSLRNLIPREMQTGFGFLHGKPNSGLAPFAVTPDELGSAWQDGRVALDLECRLNGTLFGHPNGKEMHFSFFELIEHAAKTRDLQAGTILGSGTFSNVDESVGSTCLAEQRMLEKIKTGTMQTPFMKEGDIIEMEMKLNGRSLFGLLRQEVVAAK